MIFKAQIRKGIYILMVICLITSSCTRTIENTTQLETSTDSLTQPESSINDLQSSNTIDYSEKPTESEVETSSVEDSKSSIDSPKSPTVVPTNIPTKLPTPKTPTPSPTLTLTPTPFNIEIIKVDFEDYYLSNGKSFARGLQEALKEASSLSGVAQREGKPYKVVVDIKNRTYEISYPISISRLNNIEINGNGSTIINKSKSATINIDRSNNVGFSNFSIDYDPLPYTQGVITQIDNPTGGFSTITLKVDAGYNSDALSLRSHEGIFNIHSRETRSPSIGSRQFYSVSSVENKSSDELLIKLGWGINDAGSGQIPVKVGDVGVIRPFNGDCAINITNSFGTYFTDFNIFSSPNFGLLENGGDGGMIFTRFNIIPGPKPSGANYERLSSVNRDATHFISVKNGPAFENCKLMNSGDDVINVHGFYYFVMQKISDRRYYLTPKWDIGIEKGDLVEALDQNTFSSKGTATITEFKKITASTQELRDAVKAQWEGAGRSPSAAPTRIYDVTFDRAIQLKIGDAVTSLDRLGKNTTINNSEFHGGGRVNIKGPNAVITNNKFSYTLLTAIHIGSDIGFWAESHFSDGAIIKNNTFNNCGVSANSLFDKEVNGSIYVSLTAPLNRSDNTFFNNFMNKGVVIENNTINNSYYYGIVLTNADGASIRNNIISEVFLNSPFNIGFNYGISPQAGILVAQTRNSTITDNSVSSKMHVWQALDIAGNNTNNTFRNNVLK